MWLKPPETLNHANWRTQWRIYVEPELRRRYPFWDNPKPGQCPICGHPIFVPRHERQYTTACFSPQHASVTAWDIEQREYYSQKYGIPFDRHTFKGLQLIFLGPPPDDWFADTTPRGDWCLGGAWTPLDVEIETQAGYFSPQQNVFETTRERESRIREEYEEWKRNPSAPWPTALTQSPASDTAACGQSPPPVTAPHSR
jgi:hypothetical protein